jgi:acetyl esterase/lipase
MSIPALAAFITLSAVAFIAARKGSAWKLRFQFAAAFRAGRKFYQSHPHIAKDIAYGDRARQTLDVYWPPDVEGKQLPVLLFVHGGSWNWGDKTLYPLVGARFTARGFVVVVINYSLYPEASFPAFVEDAAAAIAWTARHIDAYHGDPGRLFIAGHSSGGHILSLVALDDRYLAAHGLTRHALRGLVAISAPTDLAALQRHLEAHPDVASVENLQAVMGGAGALPQADPIRRVDGRGPPILLLHGVDDTTVPIAIARNFASALKAAGARVELREYDRTDHFSILLDGVRDDARRPARLLVDAVEFVTRITAESIAASTEDAEKSSTG